MIEKSLSKLIDLARKIVMTPAQRDAQARSFVYGNCKLANDDVTREMVDQAAAKAAEYRCTICGSRDRSHYLRCDHPGCHDGRDQ